MGVDRKAIRMDVKDTGIDSAQDMDLYCIVLMGWSLLPKCTATFLRSVVLPRI